MPGPLIHLSEIIMNTDFKKYLTNDIFAGTVVFLVALPLCLGIALASGAPMFAGLIAGILGGLVVGAISGSKIGVSGPAAGLTVIVLSAIEDLQAYEAFLLAVVFAGILQIIMGVLKSGLIAYYFPTSVIKGMLAAIGLILILKQIPHALGYDAAIIGDDEFVQQDGHNTFSELWYALQGISPGAFIISFVGLTILILWEQRFVKKVRLFNLLPGAIVAVLIGALLNEWFKFAVPSWALAGGHMVEIPQLRPQEPGFGVLFFPDWSFLTEPAIYLVAFKIAIVASLETLLCLEATDKLDPLKRTTPVNRELIAQGIGNTFSGLIGGLPLTQVIVRSSTNIASGGRTKTAAIFHGILLAVFVLAFPGILRHIPLAALAAVLLMVGYKLSRVGLYRQMAKNGVEQFVPFMATVVGVVFTDLLIGVMIGLGVAILFLLRHSLLNTYSRTHKHSWEDGKFKLVLAQEVTFLNKVTIRNVLGQVPDGCDVEIDMSHCTFLDHDVQEIIQDFEKTAANRSIQVRTVQYEMSKTVASNVTEVRE